ncbi:metal-dependent hydrolase [Ramlibacter henchirensis]|uniref:Metal-dependent hydrolase n=1 Tax=Ramlibacter henchirensis TaxID=204072 RepID=A0A4Z0C747_9BURK|nr:metal-dependent hydrolase [Ramlibacter henchirensis]TFZ06722.1 metal-dependent hydrolase [Ramlibacter henchirensis]
MDSVSQLALGAAVGVAVMGRRTALWKAALWGGVAGTLPDLDAFIDYGDAVRNMTYHRGSSHAIFWQTLASPVLAWIASRVHGEAKSFRRWWLAIWLALITHPLLDTMTVYGTQLLLPFTNHPFGVGSIFIIDPLYTLPLLIGVGVALARRAPAGLAWNRWGLILSTGYLAWSALAQAHVRGVAEQTLAARGAPAQELLVTPTAFNTVLWRVVAMREDGYEEGFYSLLDGGRPIRFERFATDRALERSLHDVWAVQRMAWFSHGFYKMQAQDGRAFITDLRMGQEPWYVFNFAVARREGANWSPEPPRNFGARGNLDEGLSWLGRRMLGEDVPPPR